MSATRTVSAAGAVRSPSSAGGTRWSSWIPRPRRRGARTSRQRPPSGARPPNPRRNHPRVQPAPDAEGADHARPRRNPLPGHPVVVVRRAPVRSEADREGWRAGDLPEVPAVPVGGQLPETPGSDEGGEEDLTGRPPGGRKSFTGPDRTGGGNPAPGPASPAVPRNGSSM